MSMRVSSKPACRELAGGCLGDFRPGGLQDFIVERAVGSHLYTTDGREFIDYLLGSGPMAVGHSNPRIVDAVLQQVRRGTTYYNVSPQVIELAELVVERVPSVQAVRFVADGSEATFYSLRLARAFTSRELVIKFEGGFHGHHDYALQSVHPPVGSDLGTRPDSDGIPDDVTRTVLIARFNDLASVELLLREHAGQVAAILVEPVQRAIMPHAGFLEGLRRLSDEHGCLLIFDEIVTAFRLDRGGAQARYGVMPDLTTLGKIMGGGLPIAAVGGRSEVMDLVRPGREGPYVYVSGTLNGNPLCAAAGVAALKMMDEEDGYRRLAEVGDKLITRIKAVATDLGTPVTITGPSPFFEIMFGQGSVNNFQDYAAFPADKRTAFALEMTEHGVYMRPNSKVYVSIAHSDDDIDQTGEAARKSILALQRRGVLE
jgi:glutamate-1-semialdehyde 2,1-aminomutase